MFGSTDEVRRFAPLPPTVYLINTCKQSGAVITHFGGANVCEMLVKLKANVSTALNKPPAAAYSVSAVVIP